MRKCYRSHLGHRPSYLAQVESSRTMQARLFVDLLSLECQWGKHHSQRWSYDWDQPKFCMGNSTPRSSLIRHVQIPLAYRSHICSLSWLVSCFTSTALPARFPLSASSLLCHRVSSWRVCICSCWVFWSIRILKTGGGCYSWTHKL